MMCPTPNGSDNRVQFPAPPPTAIGEDWTFLQILLYGKPGNLWISHGDLFDFEIESKAMPYGKSAECLSITINKDGKLMWRSMELDETFDEPATIFMSAIQKDSMWRRTR